MSAAGSGTRGPYAKSAARRDDILRAGIEVFATGGYRSSSIREIADRVGISQSGLLHHFSSKNELLSEILAVRDATSRERMIEGAGVDNLRAVIDLVRYNATVPGLVALHTVLAAEATAPEHPAHGYFQDRYSWTVGMLTRTFATMKQEGTAAPHIDPVEEAKNLVAMMDGLQVQWLLNPDTVDMVAQVRHHLVGVTLVDL